MRYAIDEPARQTHLDQVEEIVRCAFRQNSEYVGSVTQTLPLTHFSFSRLAEELHNQLINLVSIEFNTPDIVGGLFLPSLDTFTLLEGTP